MLDLRTLFLPMIISVLTSLLASAPASAQANVVTGRLWHVADVIAGAALPENVPSTPADVSFDVNSPLNFDAGAVPTVGAFLASGGAFNIVEFTGGTLGSLLSDGTIGTIMEFTGFVSVVSGQSFAVQHDDGVTLTIGGLSAITTPGPTPPALTTSTYNGPSGNFAFQLVYGECCAGDAVLRIDLPFSNAAPVPEPATLALMVAGLFGVGFDRRRRIACARKA